MTHDPIDELKPGGLSPERRQEIAKVCEELKRIAATCKVHMKILPDDFRQRTGCKYESIMEDRPAPTLEQIEKIQKELEEKWKDFLPTEVPEDMDLENTRAICAVILENQAVLMDRVDRDLLSAMLSEPLPEDDVERHRRIATLLKEKNVSKPNYVVVEDDFLQKEPLVIRDVGPWNRHMTVTNGAEEVVDELAAQGRLPEGRRLLYYDSEGQLDEILVRDGKFAGFAPGPKRTNP